MLVLILCFRKKFQKVLKLLKAKQLAFANDDEIAASNAVPGYTGPINLNAKVVIDEEILSMRNFCCGSNKEGYHYINANVKDIKYDVVGDIVNVKEGDTCPNCGGKLYFKKGIEIGNTFKLGTKYSEKFGLNYVDENNKLQPVIMGSYGIGLGRCMAAVVEQNNDDKGIIWPISIAPFKCSIVVVNTNDEISDVLLQLSYLSYLENINMNNAYNNQIKQYSFKKKFLVSFINSSEYNPFKSFFYILQKV